MNYSLILIAIDTVSGNGGSSSGGAYFGEDYMAEAWWNLTNLMSWMRNTTILTVAGEDITFMNMFLCCAFFDVCIFVLHKIFWGEV